jgi:hypothetical protein
MQNLLNIPSFFALVITGLLLLTILIIFIQNINTIKQEKPSFMVALISLITIAIGVHGLLHLGVEYVYNYNPIKMFFNI